VTASQPSCRHPGPLPEGEGKKRVRKLTDVEAIRTLLETQRAYAASAFGYLEPRLYGRTEWFEGLAGDARALLLMVSGNAGGLMYAQGAPEALEPALDGVKPFRRSYFTFEAAHEGLVRARFILRGIQHLTRMQVNGDRFLPVESHAVPLGPGEVDRINDLYAIDSGAWISRRQLGEQLYYGLWQDGRLVSVAGTQSISRSNRVAVVANVMTHPDYRGRGLARECVGALTAALLEQVKDVVLNVAPENTPAIRVYQRLGYQEICHLAEGWAFWRGKSWWDRFLATAYDWLGR